MDAHQLKDQIRRSVHRALVWGRDHVPPVVRSVIGVLLMIGGVFGFLPVLGFWMIPLGLAFIALDFPPSHRVIARWLDDYERKQP